MKRIACRVRILSEADGKKSLFSSEGFYSESEHGGEITCRPGGSPMVVGWIKEEVFIRRDGEVYLRLRLKEGEETEGEIGLSPETKGKVSVRTEKIAIGRSGKEIKIESEYVLRFDFGRQRMRIRLNAEERTGAIGE